MIFCPNCGAQLPDGANFCSRCGAKQSAPATPNFTEPAAPQPAAEPQPAAFTSTEMSPAAEVYNARFSRIPVRYRCPNGHVFDGSEQTQTCPNCSAPLAHGGIIQLYRMGNYMGCAVGMEIFINREKYGLLANKQSLRFAVPYGTHMIHVAHTSTRKCNDPTVTITPDNPYAFCKAHFSKAGFAIAVEPASPDDMPNA